MTDDGIGRLCRLFDSALELRFEVLQLLTADRDAGELHLQQNLGQWDLQFVEQLLGFSFGQFGVQCGGEAVQQHPVHPCTCQVLLDDPGDRLLFKERALAAVVVLLAELLSAHIVTGLSGGTQVLGDQICEGEVPPVRLDQVSRNQGVLDDAAQVQPAPGQSFAGVLIVVNELGQTGFCQPGR